ncbi:methyltransferase [soil metagenome]
MKQDGPDWGERWMGWRNRVLADPGFQRFAARFPLTRLVARRRANRLFDLVAGFTYSQVLAACVQTGLLESLASGAATLDDLASAMDLPRAGAERLLKAAASLQLVESLGDGRWMLGQDGAALLGNPGITAMVAHHHALYADLADPVGLLRSGGGGGALSRYWNYAEHQGAGDGAQVAPYSQLMAASQPLIAGQVIDAYPFHRHRRMLDIGGGEGAFLSAVAERAPQLALSLFDLPAVGERARVRLDADGHGNRTTIFGGNFLADALPGGHDLITLIRVLHDHDDTPAMTLLRSIRAALPTGGKLLIAEPMAGTHGAEAAGDGYFGLYLWAMGSGRPRTPAEVRHMLGEAGFASSKLLKTALPLTVRAVVATA